MSSEGQAARDAVEYMLRKALTEMVGWDEAESYVAPDEPDGREWELYWKTAPSDAWSSTTFYGNLGQVVIEYMNLDGPGDPYPMPPYSTPECDALLAIAQAYSDWVEADDE